MQINRNSLSPPRLFLTGTGSVGGASLPDFNAAWREAQNGASWPDYSSAELENAQRVFDIKA